MTGTSVVTPTLKARGIDGRARKLLERGAASEAAALWLQAADAMSGLSEADAECRYIAAAANALTIAGQPRFALDVLSVAREALSQVPDDDGCCAVVIARNAARAHAGMGEFDSAVAEYRNAVTTRAARLDYEGVVDELRSAIRVLTPVSSRHAAPLRLALTRLEAAGRAPIESNRLFGGMAADLVNGSGIVPPGYEDVADLVRRAYPRLELRVGEILSEGLSDAQLEEFEALVDTDEQACQAWLDRERPDHCEVVQRQFRMMVAVLEFAVRLARGEDVWTVTYSQE